MRQINALGIPYAVIINIIPIEEILDPALETAP